MINLPFYTIAERKPDSGHQIIWLKKSTQFGFAGFYLQEIVVEYSYEELDEDGCMTGNSFSEPAEGLVEFIVFGNRYVEDDFLWCPADEYFSILDNFYGEA